MALGSVTDGHRDRRAGVDHLGATHQAVRRLHRDAAHQAVSQVQCDLEGQRLGELLEFDVGVQRVEQRGHGAARELHVDHRAGDAYHPAVGVLAFGGFLAFGSCGHLYFAFVWVLFSGVGQRVSAADDFTDFLRDLGLTLSVGLQCEVLDEIVGVVAG